MNALVKPTLPIRAWVVAKLYKSIAPRTISKCIRDKSKELLGLDQSTRFGLGELIEKRQS